MKFKKCNVCGEILLDDAEKCSKCESEDLELVELVPVKEEQEPEMNKKTFMDKLKEFLDGSTELEKEPITDDEAKLLEHPVVKSLTDKIELLNKEVEERTKREKMIEIENKLLSLLKEKDMSESHLQFIKIGVNSVEEAVIRFQEYYKTYKESLKTANSSNVIPKGDDLNDGLTPLDKERQLLNDLRKQKGSVLQDAFKKIK